MGNLTITCQLKSVPETEKVILQALRDLLSTKFNNLASEIESKAREIIAQNIYNSDEYKSLVGGELRTEIGLADTSKAQDIVQQFISTISVKNRQIRKTGNKLTGGFDLVGLTDFGYLLSSSAAVYVTEKGVTLPWLKWLLFEGDKIIIRHYDVSYKHPERSRTGGAIMVPRKEAGSGWRVPPEYSGTESNNFLTRAIDAALPQLDSSIQSLLRQKM